MARRWYNDYNFNPPTPCGVGHGDFSQDDIFDIISIHPPRVGWDPIVGKKSVIICDFNPPTPCGVGLLLSLYQSSSLLFQSTHPVWGGTCSIHLYYRLFIYFNPPTPCGVGLFTIPVIVIVALISIHPPRVGWDAVAPADDGGVLISIHPPRVGWDAGTRKSITRG